MRKFVEAIWEQHKCRLVNTKDPTFNMIPSKLDQDLTTPNRAVESVPVSFAV